MIFYTPESFNHDTSICYLVRRTHQLGMAALEPVFAAEDLTATQWSTMVTIHYMDAPTCIDVARDLAHDKGAMTRIVDALKERGFVTRERDESDRRNLRLSLTDEGRAVAMRCRAKVIEAMNEWLSDWEREEVERLIAGLRRLRTTFERAGAAA
jgi:DNA-binding MarR family transcriptional regulator